MKTFAMAVELFRKIQQQYNLLTVDEFGFFDRHHDHLLSQLNGANEELEEMEVYIKHPQKIYGKSTTGYECFLMGYDNLEKTLTFCKAVIKLQTMTAKLPESLYC